MFKSAFLRSYPLRILPGVKDEFALRGSSLRVVSSPVTLYFEARDGSSSFFLDAGEQVDFRDAVFYQFDIYHFGATEAAIVLAVGDGAELNSAKIAGQVSVNGIVETTTKGMAYSASFKSLTNMASNTAETIFTPAANVNGAVIHACQMFSANNTGFAGIALIARNVVPLSVSDGETIAQFDMGQIAGVQYNSF